MPPVFCWMFLCCCWPYKGSIEPRDIRNILLFFLYSFPFPLSFAHFFLPSFYFSLLPCPSPKSIARGYRGGFVGIETSRQLPQRAVATVPSVVVCCMANRMTWNEWYVEVELRLSWFRMLHTCRRRTGRDRRGVGVVVQLGRWQRCSSGRRASAVVCPTPGDDSPGRRIHVCAGRRHAQLQQPAVSTRACVSACRRCGFSARFLSLEVYQVCSCMSSHSWHAVELSFCVSLSLNYVG